MREQFTFYKSYDDVIQEMNDTQIALYLKAIMDVQFLRKRIEDIKFEDNILNMIWKSQQHSMNKSINGYLIGQTKSSIKNPYFGVHNIPNEGIPTSTEHPTRVFQDMSLQEQGKEQGKEQEQVERKISPSEIIYIYKTKVSSDNKKIREVKSVNEMALNHKGHFEKILIGVDNYSKTLKKGEEKYILNLQDFLIDKTYLDYQEEKKDTKGSKMEGLYYHA